MRAILPLAILVVPGAAFAQTADPMLPGSVAPWSDEQIVPTADLTAFAEQLSPAAFLAEPADDALAALALPASEPAPVLPTVAFATTATLVSIGAFVDAGTLIDANAVAAALADADAAETNLAEGAPAIPTVVIAPAPAMVETAAVAEPAVTEIALTDAADTENTGAPIALADQAEVLFGAAPVSEGELAETKGKATEGWMAGMAAIGNNSSSINNNNVGANSSTGSVNLGGQAFQNVSGFAMVNFNTGTQASINANMVVNVQINYASTPTP